jgi:hypothetical protein
MVSPLVLPFVKTEAPVTVNDDLIEHNGLVFYNSQYRKLFPLKYYGLDDHRLDAMRYYSGSQFSEAQIQMLKNQRSIQTLNYIKKVSS